MEATETLDATGLNCPMPVVRTKQATDSLAALEARLDGAEARDADVQLLV